MNRATYTSLRQAARLAARTYWAALSNKYATTYDRDRAYTRMMDTRLAVPGGVWTPYVYPVQLDGWRARRDRVQSAIHARKTRARIEASVEQMARRVA